MTNQRQDPETVWPIRSLCLPDKRLVINDDNCTGQLVVLAPSLCDQMISFVRFPFLHWSVETSKGISIVDSVVNFHDQNPSKQLSHIFLVLDFDFLSIGSRIDDSIRVV